MQTRLDLLNRGKSFLAREGLNNSAQEAEVFLSYVLDCPRIEFYLDNAAVAQKEINHFWELLRQRVEGFPLQYLVGSTQFMGLEFKVCRDAFIPRPETEILVETILNLQLTTYNLELRVLDLGTGCGNIAVSLAKFLSKAHVFACDISHSALQLCQENSRLHKVEIKLIESNLLDAFKRIESFSLIVSNPPYISEEQMRILPRELHYEPKRAYDGGSNGLLYYRRIIKEAPDYLKDTGFLILEIGDEQAEAVKKILARSGKFTLHSIVRDYNQVQRVIVAQKI